jgi:hypothetical protein
LEQGFKAILPPTADVRAEYTSKQEAAVLSAHAEWPVRLDKESRSQKDVPWIPRETYFVCVINGTDYPLADTFLKKRVLRSVAEAILKGRT